MSGDKRRIVGGTGEAAAAAHLAGKGYTLLEANWRCRFGELDLIAEREGTIVIVEVRTRSAGTLGTFGGPLESITRKKQATLRRCAEAYLQRLPPPLPRVRFDCIGVVLNADGRPGSVAHIENAF